MNPIISAVILIVVFVGFPISMWMVARLLLPRIMKTPQSAHATRSAQRGRTLNEEEIRKIRENLSEVEITARKVSPMYGEWVVLWQALLAACQRHGAIGRWSDGAPIFFIAPPATEAEVKEVERIIHCAIPDSFRRVLLTFSSRVEISWQLKDKDPLPAAFQDLFSGECH